MKRLQLFVGLCFFAFLIATSVAQSAEIRISVKTGDTVEDVGSVPCYWQEGTKGYPGKWVIGSPGNEEFKWESDGGNAGDGARIALDGMLDPDPVINFNIAVTDFGAPSNFSFQFILPLAPQVTNPSNVFDSLSGSLLNAAFGGEARVTPLAPPAGIPIDNDGIPELQVFTLSDDNGANWQNVGLDAGPEAFHTGAFTSLPYGVFNQGPISTIAGGPWTHMRADLNFRLSGGNDSFSFSGAKVLVPEPGTIVLALLTFVFCGLRRSR